MDNFVKKGCLATLAAPYTVVAGAGALVGNLFGVAVDDVTSGADGVFHLEGIFDLLCVTTDTPAQGAKMYWDNSAKKTTSTAAGNTAIGTCMVTKASGPAVCQILLQPNGGNQKIMTGETALDGTNPTAVVTGLTAIVGFVATLKGSAAPGLSTSTLTATVSAGTASVYAWKPTGAGDTTLIASTGTETFYWVAVGY